MFKIKWRKHQKYNDYIIGMVEQLPDHYCQFLIGRLDSLKFHISLPTRGNENLSKRLILRDANVARDFCEDFLNHNLKEIVNYQLKEMQRTNMDSIKSVQYYQNFLVQYQKNIEKIGKLSRESI